MDSLQSPAEGPDARPERRQCGSAGPPGRNASGADRPGDCGSPPSATVVNGFPAWVGGRDRDRGGFCARRRAGTDEAAATDRSGRPSDGRAAPERRVRRGIGRRRLAAPEGRCAREGSGFRDAAGRPERAAGYVRQCSAGEHARGRPGGQCLFERRCARTSARGVAAPAGFQLHSGSAFRAAVSGGAERGAGPFRLARRRIGEGARRARAKSGRRGGLGRATPGIGTAGDAIGRSVRPRRGRQAQPDRPRRALAADSAGFAWQAQKHEKTAKPHKEAKAADEPAAPPPADEPETPAAQPAGNPLLRLFAAPSSDEPRPSARRRDSAAVCAPGGAAAHAAAELRVPARLSASRISSTIRSGAA